MCMIQRKEKPNKNKSLIELAKQQMQYIEDEELKRKILGDLKGYEDFFEKETGRKMTEVEKIFAIAVFCPVPYKEKELI